MPVILVRAVLETSFWTVAYRAEVTANCLDLYEIIVPRAVEAEIRALQASEPRREYPHATLFRRLQAQISDPPEMEPEPLPGFGRGEAAAIPLAAHLAVVLLINERGGARHARNLGIQVVTVPAVIVDLRAQDVISDRAARRKLELIEPYTAAEIIRDAHRTLDAL